MFRRGAMSMGRCLFAMLALTGLFASEARSACPIGLTVFAWNSGPISRSNLPQIAGLPGSCRAQVIIVGNDKVGQDLIISQSPLYPAQILCYHDSGPDVGKGPKPNRGFERQQSSPQADAPDAHDKIDFPFFGTEELRENRQMSLLFGGPGWPNVRISADAGLTGSIVLNERHIVKKLIQPQCDPFAFGPDWECPELIGDVRNLREDTLVFEGPTAFLNVYRGLADSVGEICFARRPNWLPLQIFREPSIGNWHAELMDSLNDSLLLMGGGVQADAGWRGVIKPYDSILLELMRQMDSESVRMNNARTNALQDILVLMRETATGSLLFGVGVNSDAGLTGSLVINERTFDVADPGVNSSDARTEAAPGTQAPQDSIRFPTTPIEDKPLFFRFEFGYYRIR